MFRVVEMPGHLCIFSLRWAKGMYCGKGSLAKMEVGGFVRSFNFFVKYCVFIFSCDCFDFQMSLWVAWFGINRGAEVICRRKFTERPRGFVLGKA